MTVVDPVTAAGDGAPAPGRPDGGPRWQWRREVLWFLELFALSGIAFAQPMFSTLADNALEVVAPWDPSPRDVVATALVAIVGPPFVLWGIGVLAGLALPRARAAAHPASLALLAGVTAFEVAGNQLSFPTVALVLIAVAVAAAITALVARVDAARLYLRVLGVAPVAFAVVFLTSSGMQPFMNDERSVPAHEVTVARPSRIVFLTFDELPTVSLLDGSGAVDRELFPNFAALADDATWYRNATSVAPYTRVAVPALLTGRYPDEPERYPIASEYPDNLFTLLGDTYRINAHEAASEHLCPSNLCPGEGLLGTVRGVLDEGISLWRDFAAPGSGEAGACLCDETTIDDQWPSGRRFVRSLRAASDPVLDYLHVELPHAPWHLLPTGQSFDDEFDTPPGLDMETLAWADDTWAALSRQRHVLQLQAADRLLGDVVARLRDLDDYDDAAIVVTADHGVAFDGGEPYRVATPDNVEQIAWVPLFVKQPSQASPDVDDRAARTIDVLPTVAATIGTDVPWELDGRSLLEPDRGDADEPVRFMDWATNNAFVAPTEAVYQEYDRTAGFARVVASPRRNPEGDGALRAYGVGTYARLVGREAAPYVDQESPGTDAIMESIAACRGLDAQAAFLPCAYQSGGLAPGPLVDVAIAANGWIAGVSPTTLNYLEAPSFEVILAPQFLRDGRNRIELFVVEGDPKSPRLVPVRLVG